MLTALITGITGQDGTLLAHRLAGEGVAVHGLIRAEDDPAAVATGLPAGVRLHVGDLADGDALGSLVAEVAPDELYNLGGISSVGYSWEHPVQTGLISGLGAVAVFDAAWRAQERTGRPVRVLQASSAEMFGNPDTSPQDERTAIRPVSPYGAAKAYAHQMAAVYRTRDLHVATCILYNHESPLRPPTFVTRKITQAAAAIGERGSGVVSLGNLEARRDWGWAPDYVDAMVLATRFERAEDFVVATGRTRSVAEFVASAFARVGIEDWRAHVEVDPRFFRPVDPGEVTGDPSRARDLLGWSPTVSFDEMVGRMVDHDLALLRGEA